MFELHELIDKFEKSEDAHQKARELAFRDTDYYHNFEDNHWTEYEKAVLRKRKQQPVTSNHIKRKVDFLRGHEQNTRTDPKAYARRPDHEQAAEIATDAIRYVEENINLDLTLSDTFIDLAVCGIEAVEMGFDFQKDMITFDQVPFDNFFYDPRSRRVDFSDAGYMGYSQWMSRDEAKNIYPEESHQYLETFMDRTGDEGHEDKPDKVIYYDKKNDRVRIIVVYCQVGGEWYVTHYTGFGILYHDVSPYKDEYNMSTCGIIAQTCYVSRDNQRYGIVRDMISLQDERNHLRSKQMHLLADNRTWGVKGFTDNVDKFKESMARPDGHAEVESPRSTQWDFIDNFGEFSGVSQMLATNAFELGEEGPNSGMRGRGTEGQSGRAIIAQQQAGLTQENTLFDAHGQFKRRIYRAMWELVKQYWTQPKWIRIRGAEQQGREPFVGVNQPILNEFGMQTGTQNPLAKIDVDILIETAPDFITVRQEQFKDIMQVLPAVMESRPDLIPLMTEMMIENSELPQKDRILERMRAQEQQGPSPEQQMVMEMEARNKMAEIAETEASAQDKMASAEKKQAETVKVKIEAATTAAKGSTGVL